MRQAPSAFRELPESVGQVMTSRAHGPPTVGFWQAEEGVTYLVLEGPNCSKDCHHA